MPERRRIRSWVDVLLGWLDRIPGPAWATYAVLIVLSVVVMVAMRIVDGVPINVVTMAFGGLTFGPLAVMHYSNRAARRALRDFRPALGELEPEYPELERRLTTTSFASGLVAIVIGVAVVVIGQVDPNGQWGIHPGNSLQTTVVTLALQVVLNVTFAAFLLHAFGQVVTIARIHREATNIELWFTPPHNAFARVTVLTALAVTVPYALIEVASAYFNQNTVIESLIFAVTVAVGVLLFALPLVGMRGRLVSERERQLNENDHASEIAAGKLRAAVDTDQLGRATELQTTLAGLTLERDRLKKVSTYPWSGDTIRAFVTTLGIPVLLWFLTTLLGRVLFG